ncbi:MAG: hypothetical protein ABSB41_08640 [Anaerolineales bacterium]|jgi:hypothetical protein
MLWFYRFVRTAETALLLVLVAAFVGGSTGIARDETDTIRRFTRPIEFDFVTWTLDALGVKLAQVALGTPYYFDPSARPRIVTDYVQLVGQIQNDEGQLNLIYSNPSIHDPRSASVNLRKELANLNSRESQLGPVAESILQDEVSTVIAQEGLAIGGEVIPPVLFHITPLPDDLVVSPRNKVQEDAAISLVPGIPVDQQSGLEDRVDKAMNVSTLVTPVGGIATYPTMVEQVTDLNWLTDTVSHEWTHNWLTLRPLGLNYDSSPLVRSMNETTADISGGEISAIVLKRFYPELVGGSFDRTVSLPAGPVGPKAIPIVPFDFRAEMHTTRVRVDTLLAAGKINQAETYMDERRLIFWDNGYPIRKLNQAYFAFYGAYEDIPGGAAGEDPVGPAVRALRARSKTLADFLNAIAAMSSFQQLQTAVSR